MYRVLLAEDDHAVRDMLRTMLERDGFEVVAVASVRDAQRTIRRLGARKVKTPQVPIVLALSVQT